MRVTVLVFVHLPKTAGSSFVAGLREHFDETATRSDFGDLPMNTPRHVRNRAAVENASLLADDGLPGIEFVHGHFLALKYLLLAHVRPTQFVTWLRHPADRLRSNYDFWLRHPEVPAGAELKRRVLAERWSFERFCFSEEMRNMYASLLWGFPLELFMFVGIMEHYGAELTRFSSVFPKLPIRELRVNAAPDPAGSRARISPELRAEIEAFHDQDMRIYARALAMRDEQVRR